DPDGFWDQSGKSCCCGYPFVRSPKYETCAGSPLISKAIINEGDSVGRMIWRGSDEVSILNGTGLAGENLCVDVPPSFNSVPLAVRLTIRREADKYAMPPSALITDIPRKIRVMFPK
ncbi:hypothetical protein, partial [Roseovarius sp.]